jgi:membrane protease YdiL (CAAX protease family)
MALLSWLFPEAKPHPLVELLKERSGAGPLLISALAAVIVAPVVEEFLFRVVFQGWMERVIALYVAPHFAATHVAEESTNEPIGPLGPRYDQGLQDDLTNPYRSPTAMSYRSPLRPEGTSEEASWVMAVPIVISSACFALVHAAHGVAPYPLFLFALALGYLYQRTHRLIAPVVLHACLNACSLLFLFLQTRGA